MLRATFIALSQSNLLRHLSERSTIGRKLSGRFVAGVTTAEVLDATRKVNALGMSATIDNLGENVADIHSARNSAQLYHDLLDQIHDHQLNANVSLKLTHMGFDVDQRESLQITSDLVAHAARLNGFARIDMEGSAYTQRTVDAVLNLHARPGNQGRVGAVIQAYLYRSERDVEELLAAGIRIRLCKGAYKEPPSIAFPKKEEVDANYIKLVKLLLKSGIYHGIATHDERMIEAAIAFSRAEKVPHETFEFQMLYGVRRDLQLQLVKQGYRMRVYIPFGTEWYPYLMRRLAERPANAMFLLKNLFRGA